jgi:homoserine kinase
VVTHWLAELDGRRLSVEVPASAANLGAGYDCLGLALGMVNRIDLEVRGWSRGEIELEVEGEGEGELPADGSNRFVQGLEAVLHELRGPIPEGVGWLIQMRNAIPLGRGLGSSAAAAVGGVLAANALLGEPLTTADMLRLAARIEGHPDNAAAALLGGFTIAARIVDDPDGPIEAMRFDVPRELRAVLFIPELRLSTVEMRRALPARVPLSAAVANLGRVALGVGGLATGRYDLLRALTVDRLHEPYRAKAYPQLPLLVAAAREAGAIGACLSGAGSSVLAFADSVATFSRIEGALAAVAADQDLPGRIEVVMPRNVGARVLSRL